MDRFWQSVHFNSNSPDALVRQPHLQPSIVHLMVAPATGSFVAASMIFPLTIVCAFDPAAAKTSINSSANFIKGDIIIDLFINRVQINTLPVYNLPGSITGCQNGWMNCQQEAGGWKTEPGAGLGRSIK